MLVTTITLATRMGWKNRSTSSQRWPRDYNNWRRGKKKNQYQSATLASEPNIGEKQTKKARSNNSPLLKQQQLRKQNDLQSSCAIEHQCPSIGTVFKLLDICYRVLNWIYFRYV